MAIDFEILDDAQLIRERVRKWVHDECIPVEQRLIDGEEYKTVLGELHEGARSGPLVPLHTGEHGGMGLGPLANALVQWNSARAISALS